MKVAPFAPLMVGGALPESPSKTQEMAHLRSFIAGLPICSYLRSFLDGAEEFAEDAMKNDVSTELLPAVRRMRSELYEDCDRMSGDLKTLREERDRIKREVSHLMAIAVRVRDYSRDAASAMATCHSDFMKVTVAARDMVLEADLKRVF